MFNFINNQRNGSQKERTTHLSTWRKPAQFIDSNVSDDVIGALLIMMCMCASLFGRQFVHNMSWFITLMLINKNWEQRNN